MTDDVEEIFEESWGMDRSWMAFPWLLLPDRLLRDCETEICAFDIRGNQHDTFQTLSKAVTFTQLLLITSICKHNLPNLLWLVMGPANIFRMVRGNEMGPSKRDSRRRTRCLKQKPVHATRIILLIFLAVIGYLQVNVESTNFPTSFK